MTMAKVFAAFFSREFLSRLILPIASLHFRLILTEVLVLRTVDNIVGIAEEEAVVEVDEEEGSWFAS